MSGENLLLLTCSPQGGRSAHFGTWFQFSWEPSQRSHDNRALFLFFSLISLVCQTLVHVKHWLCSSALSSFHSRHCPLFPLTHKQTQAFYFCGAVEFCVFCLWRLCVSVRMSHRMLMMAFVFMVSPKISYNNDTCPFSVCRVLA